MRWQLRVRILALFSAFFFLFLTFLALYSRYFYQAAVVDNLKSEWPGILESRLIYSSQSVSTAFYIAERAFIVSVFRVKNLYELASVDPFPLSKDGYPVVDSG